MQRRIQTVTFITVVLTAGIIVGGLQVTPPEVDEKAQDPILIAVASTPDSLRVGDRWDLALTVSNVVGEEIQVRRPRLAFGTVELTIDYWPPGVGAENDPTETVIVSRIHTSDEAETIVLDADESRTFPLLSVPAVRAGRYAITASFRWLGDHTVTTQDVKQVTIIPGQRAGESIQNLAMVLETKSATGETGTLRLEFLPDVGLATALHVAALASDASSPYPGTLVRASTESEVHRLGFGARDAGGDLLAYSHFANVVGRDVSDEGYLVGLAHDADNLNSGKVRFDIVLGTPSKAFLDTHLPFARLVGGTRHANLLAVLGRKEDSGVIDPEVRIESVTFEPKPKVEE